MFSEEIIQNAEEQRVWREGGDKFAPVVFEQIVSGDTFEVWYSDVLRVAVLRTELVVLGGGWLHVASCDLVCSRDHALKWAHEELQKAAREKALWMARTRVPSFGHQDNDDARRWALGLEQWDQWLVEEILKESDGELAEFLKREIEQRKSRP